jgi:type IV secretion system protein VirB6
MLTPTLLAQVTLFTKIDHDIQRQLDLLVTPAVNNLTGALQTTALLGGTLYILIVGLTIVLGADSTPFYTFLKTAGKIALVAAFSLSSEGYLGGLMAALRGLESGLMEVFHLSTSADAPGGGLPAQLDNMLDLGFNKLVTCFERAHQEGVLSPGAALAWVLTGMVFGLSTAALAIFGGAITILVQFALAILFSLGPLFVLSLMFPQTAGFFHRWLGEVLSFLLQNVVVAIVLSFALSLFLTFLKGAEIGKEGDATSPFKAAMEILVVALVMAYFLWKSGPMVAGLSGGMGSSNVDAVGAVGMSKAIGGKAASGAQKAASGVKQAFNAAKKAGSGISRTASYLAHFGKPQKLAASSSDSSKGDKASSSSSAAKDAASSSSSSVASASTAGNSRPSRQERKATKLGAKALRAKALGNFAAESTSKQQRPVGNVATSAPNNTKPSKSVEPLKTASAPQTNHKQETKNVNDETKRI